MLTETKRDLVEQASKLAKPYEDYSIDDLADAYCEAVDTNNDILKNIYISALILRFWHKIDKMYRAISGRNGISVTKSTKAIAVHIVVGLMIIFFSETYLASPEIIAEATVQPRIFITSEYTEV